MMAEFGALNKPVTPSDLFTHTYQRALRGGRIRRLNVIRT